MQFQRIHVQNWRCFTDESVRFEDGITVLYGNNGSGKSSLLEAAFFALYGSDALEAGTNMEDVVTTDEDTAEVTLSFAHRGESYEVTREIRIRSSTTQSANLTTPPGQPDLDQINAIDELIEEELRLNAEDFLNSAYVQQGDVSRLIEATPKQRQRIIDNLLQMSKLERYRARMDSIETGVSRVVDTKEDQVEELNKQIDEYDEPQIKARKQRLHGFESTLEDKRDSIKNKIEILNHELSEAEEIVTEQKDSQQAVQEAEEDIEAHITGLADSVSEHQSLQEDYTAAETTVEQYQEELEQLFSIGQGNLSTDFASAADIVDELVERAGTIVTEGIEEATADGRLKQGDGDPRNVALSLVDKADDDSEQGSTHTADTLLTDISSETAPITAAVTEVPRDDSVSTIETTDVVDETDIDPLINPTVEIDTSLVRVPEPDLDADPAIIDLGTAEDAQDQIRATVDDIRDRLQAIEAAVEDAESDADRFEQDAQEHSREIDSALTEASTKLADIANVRQARSDITDKRDQLRTKIKESPFDVTLDNTDPNVVLEALIDTIDRRIARLEAEQEHCRDEAARLDERIEQADRLLDEGKCPECGRPVEGAPNVEHREQWEDDRQSAKELAEALQEGIADLQHRQDKATDLLETAESLYGDDLTVTISGADAATGAIQVDPDTDLAPLHEEAAEHYLDARENRQAAQQKRFQAVVQHLTAIVQTRSAKRTLAHLTRGLALKDILSQIEEAVDNRRSAERDRELAKTQLDTQADEVTNTHTELQDAIKDHSDAVDAFDPEKFDQAKQTVAEIEGDIDDFDNKLEDLQTTGRAVSEHLGDLGQQLTQLDTLRTKRDTRQREATAVSALNSQVDKLEEMFVNLRADLREQNVHRLEDLLQEMFGILYRNDAYADIKLDREYDATLIEKGGGELPPAKLSGGESAVFNLALRGAIYRLLTEGFEDDVPMPPLILDEPTAHLDDGHVDRLSDVVEAMRTAGVKQTIVVSHDEGLIDSADHRIQVSQQQGTNRSTAEPQSQISIDL